MCRHFGSFEWEEKTYDDEFNCMMSVVPIYVYVCAESTHYTPIICSLTYPCVQLNRALQLNWVHHTFAARKRWWWALLRLPLVCIPRDCEPGQRREQAFKHKHDSNKSNTWDSFVSFRFVSFRLFVCLSVCSYDSLLFFIVLFIPF